MAAVANKEITSPGAPTAHPDEETLRRCLATGESRPKTELLRFVVGPDDTLVFDLSERLPGRGLWLSADGQALERACAKRLFARAARQPLTVPADLAALVERALYRQALDLIGLARRAGQATAGFEKVKAKLAAGQVALLIQAGDAAEDGRRKLSNLGRAANPALPIIECFAAADLGRVLGREQVVHLAVAPGGLAERIAIVCGKLQALAGHSGQDKQDRDA